MHVNWENRREAPRHGVASSEHAAVDGAVAHSDNPFWRGRRIVCPKERFAHVFRNRPRDEQDVRVPRGRDNSDPDAFEIVEGVVQRVNFELAAIAGPGIDLTNSETATQSALGGGIELGRKVGHFRVVECREALCQGHSNQTLEQKLAHDDR